MIINVFRYDGIGLLLK